MINRKSIYLLFIVSILFTISCTDKNDTKIQNDKKSESVKTETIEKVVQSEKQKSLPEFIILDKIKLINGNTYADILIKSFSRSTPINEREATIKSIAKKENLQEISLYSTENAQKATFSSSFANTHPNALKNGYLGSFEKGVFTPGEEIYP